MDIVIPYKQDIHNGLELKYALRSIEKYLTGFRDIYIVGEKPEFLVNVIHIQAQDLHMRKEYSVKQKILIACDSEVSEDFIMWHDDHFILKPLNVTEIKYWQNGPLEELAKKAGGGYKQAVLNTIKQLEGFPQLNYDIHVPMVFNKVKFKEIMTKYLKEYCNKSLYANQAGVLSEHMEDIKINLPHYEEKLRKKIAGRTFFSTGPISIQKEMLELFEELYPKPSKYENSPHP